MDGSVAILFGWKQRAKLKVDFMINTFTLLRSKDAPVK